MELKTNYPLSAFRMAPLRPGNGPGRGWQWGKWEGGGKKEVATGRLCECEGLEGLLGFNLCRGMGQSVGKGTEEERDQKT